MNLPILSSTFFLTLLLMMGLFFFIRASAKDRIERIKLTPRESVDQLLSQLQVYFTQRAYHISSVDPKRQTMTFEGFVSPSWFLAIFLSGLAAIGLFCFSLILSFLYPSLTLLFLGLVLLCPVGGIFYWKKSGRVEKVLLEVKMISESNQSQLDGNMQSLVIVTAHRDELARLQKVDFLKSGYNP
ncbi:MAG: cofactor assembly of complex C subunit B [cyanobacterium endosymbiont of Rhopalodia musculus]|uniref:cofactor assembly of complex C subunit B n=1 Tax=cyanobacterium endosymbiont of Epithemia clementina EcSB TaxID=3034674 RepID=UPI0024814840|nr:cofactor assembly of complex C subunit B [cyanobacterium endosymbiont of Epithemia clementina EcSB]WGT68072.1 cofactor assembly of complex C subunit B [cyanobacterium endosymbiont of Epithemia clementina EcSB]